MRKIEKISIHEVPATRDAKINELVDAVNEINGWGEINPKQTQEPERKEPWTCPICKKQYIRGTENVGMGCLVLHGEGSCCHFNDKEIKDEKPAKKECYDPNEKTWGSHKFDKDGFCIFCGNKSAKKECETFRIKTDGKFYSEPPSTKLHIKNENPDKKECEGDSVRTDADEQGVRLSRPRHSKDELAERLKKSFLDGQWRTEKQSWNSAADEARKWAVEVVDGTLFAGFDGRTWVDKEMLRARLKESK